MPQALRLATLLLCLSGAWAGPAGADLARELDLLTMTAPEGEQATYQALRNLYQAFDFQPLWNDPALLQQLADGIEASYADGLNPMDYRPAETTLPSGDDPRRDIALSKALADLLSDLYFGKVDPAASHADWNVGDLRQLDDNPNLVPEAIRQSELTALFEVARPQQRFYRQLRAKLAEYRALEAAGGWPELPADRLLKPGTTDPAVPALRTRLTLTGDAAPATGATSARYDAELVAAVRHFQRRHLLSDDGVVGPDTWAALNRPVASKITQIRANLERMRWTLKGLGGEFLLVDIAGYQLHLVREEEFVWSSPVQVGKPYRETPVFTGRVRYIEWNPTWTVPPTILKQDVLPAIRRDAGYLQRKNMVVLSFSGEPVDPASIDWSLYPEREFPYLLRQLPGPENALGTVKFIFPNDHAVYLHDTPSRSLFKQTNRAFSSGCIRVARPYELARLLLGEQMALDDEDIQAILASGETRRHHLAEGFPIVILYWTTKWLPDGSLVFAPDIYQRDAAIVAALDNATARPESQASLSQR